MPAVQKPPDQVFLSSLADFLPLDNFPWFLIFPAAVTYSLAGGVISQLQIVRGVFDNPKSAKGYCCQQMMCCC